jgi:magnesium and cobalt transporter
MNPVRSRATSLDEPEQGLFGFLRSILRKKSHIENGTDLAEEIQEIMDEGQARGLISDEESEMVSGVLDLKETKTQAIMVPRTEIASAPVEATLGQVIQLMITCGHTRIPIHKDTIDQIVAILHAKDLLRLWGSDPAIRVPEALFRTPHFVSENVPVSQVLRSLRERKTHLAVVTDEYGGTAGIVTLEDILEEIVGEIMDEHDTEESLLSVLDDGRILVDARLELEKLEDHLGIRFPEGDYASVGGFIIERLGRIPKINEKVRFEDMEFTIEKADQRRIKKILITRRGSPPEEQGKEPAAS